jgi:hypothetical protein
MQSAGASSKKKKNIVISYAERGSKIFVRNTLCWALYI